MERNKSSRQSNTQLLKEVLVHFDIETQVNKIAFRCFGDLLKSHQQTFQYMKQSEKKMIDFEARLFKSEGFANSIEANVASKLEITNNLNRRIQTFSLEFFTNLKDNEALIKTMRRDYDGLVTSSQRNNYQIRSITDDLKRNFAQVNRIQTKLQKQMTKLVYQHEQQTNKLQQQLAEARRQDDRFMKLLTEARAEFLAKGTSFEDVSNDMALYKYEKETILNQLANLTNELQTKMPRTQYLEMRLLFDSQMVTTHEHNDKIFKQLQLKNKNQDLAVKQSLQEINEISKGRWARQQATNSLLQQNSDSLKLQMTSKTVTIIKKIDDLDNALQTSLKKFMDKQNLQNLSLLQKTEQQSENIQKLTTQGLDFQKLFQQNDGRFREFSASLSDLSDQITQIFQQSSLQKQNMYKLQATLQKQSATSSESKLGGQAAKQIQNNRRDILQLTEDLQKSESRQQKMEKKLDQFNRKQEENVQNRITELHRRISQVSIQIMNNIQRAENESKAYTDTFKSSIETRLQFLNEVSQEIQALKKAFEGQMLDTQELNKVLTQKMEKTTSILTKFKSDFSIRVEAIGNQQQRRNLQIKQSTKNIEEIKKYLSNLTQIITLTLSIIVSQEYTVEGDNKEAVKMSSLIEGWVLELDDKNQKYRGQIIHRRKLAMLGLNFLIVQTDKIKGGLIDSGKDIFNRMIEESQEIFSIRKRGLSRRMGSQLPKLHF